jgi:uncharacterized protein (DUF58 family)
VLDPAIAAAIDDLELAARGIVEGLSIGAHRSPLHGFSAEFSQHRAYRPGDDLKYLDWKLLARTDRLYTRQFRETTNLAAVIAIDGSASMAFPERAPSKLAYSRLIAAALSHLIVSQGDRVGFLSAVGERFEYVPPKPGRAHLRTLLARLSRLPASGSMPFPRIVSRAADLLRRRGVLIAISDFYDADSDRELARTVRRGHDVSAIQVLSREEIDFPYRGAIDFSDLESSAERVVDAGAAAAEYRAALAKHLERLRNRLLAEHVDYTLMRTDAGPAESLRAYLIRRDWIR